MAEATNLREFQLSVDKELDIIPVASRAVRKIALDVLSGIVKGTRVETGRARGNWHVSTGSLDRREVEDFPVYNVDPASPIEQDDSTITRGEAQLSGLNRNPFTIIYVQNNLPYIEFLESLDHMVDLTVTRVSSSILGT